MLRSQIIEDSIQKIRSRVNDSKMLVMGQNLPAVDATCARIMKLNPEEIGYLRQAHRIGPINKRLIEQRGEKIIDVQKEFKLHDFIPAHRRLRA